jgi:hypothetical protein
VTAVFICLAQETPTMHMLQRWPDMAAHLQKDSPMNPDIALDRMTWRFVSASYYF